MMTWYWLLVLMFPGLLFTRNVEAKLIMQQPASQPEQLLKALEQYKKIAFTNVWATFPEDICLRPGDTNQYISKLRNNLCLTEDLQIYPDSVTLLFDAGLTQAVKKFQYRHGLLADGIVGHQTLVALNITPALRVKQIELNLTRWQLSSGAIYPRVFVNIPDFTLQLLNAKAQVIWQTKVIVGQTTKAYQTALINSKISYLVLKPTWNIPKSIIRNEIIPILKTDPNYLARNHMSLYRQSSKGKIKINPTTINWQTVDLNAITIIQGSGPWNALGKIKFIFPNPYDTYLHDTPIKSLFSHPVRAYSHGCVRVQNPEILAAYLLSPDQEKLVSITNLLKENRNEKIVYLPKPVPVQIGYFTCWVDEEGLLQFRNDIYNLDIVPNL